MKPTAAVLALGALVQACVRGSYYVHHYDQAPDPSAVAGLVPGKDDLGSCLARLGAPHFVFEYARDGAALAWAYGAESGLGFGAAYTVQDFANVSFDFDNAWRDLDGLVLWFREDLVLERWRRGRLADLTRDLRRRPAAAGAN
ncbi:MAG: hypothetical protein Fur0037_14550 [Planctomycetota bacterium]